ncbi:unnamed protein product [Cylicocyclus nassatus]|uniref:Peptidase C1A papain C-terminal domain-containing protein n=1 Tax=Cylicocyclus nassatus TaxID=53992 RepID=A0AA36GQ62_CYLNA|nr:unnamed protein product [Cylicocyclus nassatus]
MRLFLLLIGTALAVNIDKKLPLYEAEKLTGEDLVAYLKKHQKLFEVGETPEGNRGMQHLMDPKYLRAIRGAPVKTVDIGDEQLPENFDARDKWPNCISIPYIRDQSNCGSCWAVSAASAMSDRLCVQSEGKFNSYLSDTDILACCGSDCGYGCEGGYPIEAWKYLVKYGVVTGGRYREKGVCKPYAFHPCGKPVEGEIYYGECPTSTWPTPRCEKFCQRGYPILWKQDKHYGISAYKVAFDETEIMKEIYKNGPVQASFEVYADFREYKGGIYHHTAGSFSGGHAVKLLGWGVENGEKYWLLANSWGKKWGENGGYFRMLRGVNECNMENDTTAGMFY